MYTHCMRYTAPAVTLIHPLKRIYFILQSLLEYNCDVPGENRPTGASLIIE